jgi:hypothetical protein
MTTRKRYQPTRVAWTRESPGRYVGEGIDGSRWLARQWAVQEWRLHSSTGWDWDDLRFYSLEDAHRAADDQVREETDPEYAARCRERRAELRRRRAARHAREERNTL